MGGKRDGKGRKGDGKARREGKGGKEEKGRGAYRDEDPLTKILNTPLTDTETPKVLIG